VLARYNLRILPRFRLLRPAQYLSLNERTTVPLNLGRPPGFLLSRGEIAQWEVEIAQWEVEIAQWEVEIAQWEVEIAQWEVEIAQWEVEIAQWEGESPNG